MEQSEEDLLKKLVNCLAKLSVLQIESLMNLSTAILHIDGISETTREDAYKAFSGIQDQLNLLNELQEMERGSQE